MWRGDEEDEDEEEIEEIVQFDVHRAFQIWRTLLPLFDQTGNRQLLTVL
jgi:hypothetical protein